MHLQETLMSFSVTDVELDVTDAVPVRERCHIACTLYVPDELSEHPTVVIAVPGGTYSRRYWDLQPPGRTGYSQARYFAERGVIFAAMDYLGGGASSRPSDGDALTMAVLADAAHLAFERLRDGLAARTFATTSVDAATFVALGFSFGGSLTVVNQGKYGDCEALAIYGFSPLAADNLQRIPETWDQLSEQERREFVNASNAEVIGGELSMYHGAPRFGAWREFYRPETEDELITYDEEHVQTLVPRNAGIDAMTPRYSLPFAKQITCPIFLAFGEHDIVTDPHEQPRAYLRSRDITLTVLPSMTHLHNFMANRHTLWDRTLLWLDGLGHFVSGGPEKH